MVARYAVAKLMVTAIGAALFVALCGWLLAGDLPASDVVRFAAMVGVVFFAAVGAVAARSLFDRRAVVTIDETGVFDRRSMDRKVPWSEIEGVEAISVRGKPFYYLNVGDPVDRFTTSGLKRWLLNANHGFASGVAVSPHSLDVAPQAIREALVRYAPGG